MIRTAVFAIALTASLFFRTQPGSHDVVWWESHIPALALVVLLLLQLCIPDRFRQSDKDAFSSAMFVLTVAGVAAVFLADRANTSVYAMGITLSVPSMLYFADTAKRGIKVVLYITFVICFIAIAESGSRTGIIAMSLSAVYILSRHLRLRKRFVFAVGICAVFMLSAFLFFVKKDSSDGRAFILENTVAIITEKPAGWGKGGFEANYMLRQAEFFRNNNDETTAMLADDIKHPLNEFLYIAVNYGVHILLVAIMAMVVLIILLYKENSRESKCILHYVVLLLLWSCFSYPLSVSFVLVMLLGNIPALPGMEQLRRKRYLCYPTVLLLLVYAGIELRSFSDERAWNNAIAEYKRGNREIAMHVFDRWKEFHINKGAMLFSLATIEYNNKDYEKCIEVCNRCSNHLSSYDLEFILANSYLFTGNDEKALEHFEIAHNMCPNRFVPLYKQFKIYKEQGDTARMISIGNEILTKKIKVHSRKIDIILNNVRYELQKFKESNITTI